MMSFSMVIVLESFAPIDVVRWGINVSHIAANGDDAHHKNNYYLTLWVEREVNSICYMNVLHYQQVLPYMFDKIYSKQWILNF